MSFIRLKPQELGELLNFVFPILAFVRETDHEAGDCFLGAALDVDDDEVHTRLKDLLAEFKSKGTMEIEEIREMLRQYPPAVWARAAHTIFTTSQPRVVPKEFTDKLLQGLASVGGSDASEKKICSVLIPLIQTLPDANRHALGELCEMIKESSIDPECTAIALAPTILLPPTASESERTEAKKVLVALVEHSKALFAADANRPRGGSSITAYPSGGKPSAKLGPEELERRDALREFFEWRDPHHVDLVDDLFENFEFHDIAKGVQNKYGIIPPEFVKHLDKMVQDGVQGLEWYDKSKVAKTKRFSLLPRINRKQLAKPAAYKPTHVDRIIDEIVATEVSYYDTMKDLVDCYVKHIRDIADGNRGEAARSELGLEAAEVERIFGERLQNVLDVSNSLLTKLDLVSLVPTPPKSLVGRAGLVSKVLADHAPNLRVYAPYVSSHMPMVKTLKKGLAKVEKAERLKSASSARKLLGAEKKREVKSSFVSLWFELSSKSTYLRGHTLESILIMPVQRVPRYKLLLETLRKEVPKLNQEDPAIPIIEDAYEKVMQAARQINSAVKQHNKLESFFGKDEMISPNNSIVRVDAQGNFEAIVNSYIG